MFIIYVWTFVFAVWLITEFIKSAKTPNIEKRFEREYKEKLKRLESEFAEKTAELEKRERKVAEQEYELKSLPARVQYASNCLQKAKEIEKDVARRERELEQRKQLLLKENEEIIARKVAAGIRGKEVGIAENWKIIKRKTRVLDERELNLHKRAMLIADHLGVSLNCILTPREKKLVGELANELTEEHYALIDLVMSCPDDRAKDLLASMQQSVKSWRR